MRLNIEKYITIRNYNILYASTIFFFIFWIWIRQSIWNNEALFPNERIDIYLRDGACFYTWLRVTFAFAFIVGLVYSYRLKSFFQLWLSFGFFTFFTLLDLIILFGYQSFYLQRYPEWTSEFHFFYYKSVIEVLLMLTVNILIIYVIENTKYKFSS